MISIITAIYNQLAMNHIFYDSVCRMTDSPWELIIVDNGSTDGSREFFQSLGSNVHVVCNDGNYSYPYCQNEGIRIAKGDVLAFLNNDILLPPHWDTHMAQILGHNGYEILTLASNDRIADKSTTKYYTRRWKMIKNPILKLFGATEKTLRLMTRLCYRPNWELFSDRMWQRYKTTLKIGFAGSAVIMTRKGLQMIGGQWDPTQQAADFDLFAQTEKLYNDGLPIQPMHIVCGVYHHHYSRLTFHSKYPPYRDAQNLRSFEDKWGEEEAKRIVQYLNQNL